MNNIEELMDNIDQFQSNIKNMSLLLDSIQKIHDDYEEAIDTPRRLIARIDEINDKQIAAFEHVLQEEKKLVSIIKEYDKIIENCIDESVNKRLHNINETNEKILDEIKNRIYDYELNVNKYENLTSAFFIDIDKRFKQFVSNMEEYDERIQNSLHKIENFNLELITQKMNEFEVDLKVIKSNNKKFYLFQCFSILFTILSAISIIILVK